MKTKVLAQDIQDALEQDFTPHWHYSITDALIIGQVASCQKVDRGRHSAEYERWKCFPVKKAERELVV